MMATNAPFFDRENKDAEKSIEAGIIYFAFIQAMAIPPA
jgi:hypothetical protein